MARQSGLKSQNWGLKYFYGSNFLLSACPPRHYRFFKVHVLIILIEHFLWGLESDVMCVDSRDGVISNSNSNSNSKDYIFYSNSNSNSNSC